MFVCIACTVFMPDAKHVVLTAVAFLTAIVPCADCSLALFQHGSLLCALLGGGAHAALPAHWSS